MAAADIEQCGSAAASGGTCDPEATTLPLLPGAVLGANEARLEGYSESSSSIREMWTGTDTPARLNTRRRFIALAGMASFALLAYAFCSQPHAIRAATGDNIGGSSSLVVLQGGVGLQITAVESVMNTNSRLTQKPETLTLVSDFDYDGGPTIDIDTDKPDQEILGFGGAFTEASAVTFNKLTPELQEMFIEQYFGASGLGYTLGRVHINSCDFSVESYSFDDVPGDYGLQHFDHNLTHDKKALIPLILRAQKRIEESGRRMRLLASPWSPPSWMKTNGQMDSSGQPCLLGEAWGPWAEYIATWISDYKAAGIPIWGLSVQNEPSNNAGWEACTLTPKQEADFIQNQLGPSVKGKHPEVSLFLFDDSKHMLPDYIIEAMNRPEVAKYVDGAAFHWYSGDFFDKVGWMHHDHPKLLLLPSEATYERRMWQAGMTETYSDWRFGEGYAHDIIGDLNAGAIGWIDWNLLLDKAGGPNHVGNVCDAAVVADCEKQMLNVHPQYYFIGHFSKFMPSGSRHLPSKVKDAKPKYKAGSPPGPYGTCTGAFGLESTAARTPEGRIVVVVLNCAEEEIEFKLRFGKSAVKMSVSKRSITTFLVEPAV